jgi:hypothetical protein
MCCASAVFHQIISSENPNPVPSAPAATTASGACSASEAPITGHASASTSPVRSGRAGRQRIASSAPSTAPAPARLSSTPNTPALP